MKYRDVVDIPPPLVIVKQVRDSGTEDAARSDVETYVISERMAAQLADVVLPNLRFDDPVDNRGLFVVGTYGTGKTHLMSVIAAVAEFPDMCTSLSNKDLRETLSPVSGQFQVIRFDIGASAMSLRDIVCTELTNGLAKIGVTFKFPPLDKVTNTKDSLVEMMGAFESVFPDSGLLFVLDEMLDYLRARKDAELIQDLAFLREIGEICKNTRFRFIGGLQESLFDNPRFAGAADAIRRVKDRFEQVRIAREDVAFVVRERLLPKSSAQKAKIRDHLMPFTPMFDGMAERLDDFVDLYPLHPSYLSTFEQLTLVEKREVLRTVEHEIHRLADVDVPDNAPGVVCIDSYRARLVDDPSARTVPEVQEVLDKSEVVRNKVKAALPDKQYIESAVRIIDALAVHRLTTDDVHATIGLTVEELRDQLCLLPPGLPKLDAVFLRTTIESILAKTMVAVSGQFLGRNDDNGQIYLDIDKDIDYDQLIEQRAESLDDDRLDSAYYTAMEEALGIRDDPYVSAYKIWAYTLPWLAKNSDRMGYLFMGAPNERSTAQPPRDFYLYFLQPFDPPKFIDEESSDEVFIRLEGHDEKFTTALRRYAGARELAGNSTGARRSIYDQKASEAHQSLVRWLRDNMPQAMSVTYKGEKKTIDEWLTVAHGERGSVSQQIRSIGSHILADHFESRFPDYPTFGVEITPSNIGDAVSSALKHLSDTSRATGASRKILASLQLLGAADSIRLDGEFAEGLAAAFASAGGKVVNRSDVLVERDPGLRTWAPWHLEPLWLVVVAAALVHLGKAEIVYPADRIDALSLDRLTKMSLSDLVEFTHMAAPTSLPTDRLASVAEILGLPPGAIPSSGATPQVVTEFGSNATELIARVMEGDRVLAEGPELWGAPLVEMVSERQARIQATKSLAEDVKGRNSIGKLNKFSLDNNAIDAAREGLKELQRIELLQKSRSKLDGVASFLREAVAFFDESTTAVADAAQLRGDMIETLRADETDTAHVAALAGRGEDLRGEFVDAAAAYYRHSFLDAAGDAHKKELLESDEWAALGKLATIGLLQGGQFTNLRADLVEIGTLMQVDESDLRASVRIGEHSPGPLAGASAEARLERVRQRAGEMLTGWSETLVDNISDGDLDEQIAMLSADQRKMIEKLRSGGKLPDPVADEFVAAVDQVFRRFDIRTVDQTDFLERLFPSGAATTPTELRERFDEYLNNIVGDTSAEKIRIVLETEDRS